MSEPKKRRILTAEEKLFVINNYPTKTAKEIAKTLGVTKGCIDKFAWSKKLVKTAERTYNTGKKWTPEEEAYLMDNYGTVAVSDLMAKLGKTKWAVCSKRLELKKKELEKQQQNLN